MQFFSLECREGIMASAWYFKILSKISWIRVRSGFSSPLDYMAKICSGLLRFFLNYSYHSHEFVYWRRGRAERVKKKARVSLRCATYFAGWIEVKGTQN